MKDFKALIENISVVHSQLQQQAANAVNQSLTIRNWLIGFYIIEYEQNGKDRAVYGANLVTKLANELKDFKGIDVRSLHNFKLFYKSIVSSKVGSLTTISKNIENRVDGKHIIAKLSYTHLEQLIRIDDDLKRTFYELECIKATWSVRENLKGKSPAYITNVADYLLNLNNFLKLYYKMLYLKKQQILLKIFTLLNFLT